MKLYINGEMGKIILDIGIVKKWMIMVYLAL